MITSMHISDDLLARIQPEYSIPKWPHLRNLAKAPLQDVSNALSLSVTIISVFLVTVFVPLRRKTQLGHIPQKQRSQQDHGAAGWALREPRARDCEGGGTQIDLQGGS